RTSERVLDLRCDAAAPRITLPIAEIAAIVLLIELRDLRRPVDRKERLDARRPRIRRYEIPIAGLIVAEQVLRKDRAVRHTGLGRSKPERLVDLVLDDGLQVVLQTRSRAAGRRDRRVEGEGAVRRHRKTA